MTSPISALRRKRPEAGPCLSCVAGSRADRGVPPRSPVVVLNDLPHSPDGRQVFVGAHGVDVVQRGGVEGIAVGGCEVYPDLQGGGDPPV